MRGSGRGLRARRLKRGCRLRDHKGGLHKWAFGMIFRFCSSGVTRLVIGIPVIITGILI